MLSQLQVRRHAIVQPAPPVSKVIPLRLESVTLSGFRCFGTDPITVPLSAEITAVVGPNAAGKTALLQALGKLFGISRAQRTIERSDFSPRR